MMNRKTAVARWLAGAAVVALAGTASTETVGPPPPAAPGSPTRAQLEQLLASVRVVPTRPQLPGYERGCEPGRGCVFGPAWTDDYDGPGGHDGCDTRNNVLAAQLTEVSFRPGTRDCVVVAGVLRDPYLLATSGRVNQAKGDSTPERWLPPDRSNHCFYAAAFLKAAAHYDLPVTTADNAVLHDIARGCP